jgi:hypothetical protein
MFSLNQLLQRIPLGRSKALVVLSTGVGWAVFILVSLAPSLPQVSQCVLSKSGCLVQDGRKAVAIFMHGLTIYRYRIT